jgi:phospholipid/cholesterol/gamma-HCH transport system substrate-binding protein
VTFSLSRWQAALLGLVILVGLGLATLGVFAIGDRQGLWREHFHLYAHFPQISGIEVGTRVRVQGINAGQVDALEQPAQRGGNVVVRLRLDTQFQQLIGSDARAEIVGEGLIGGKVIEIHPGSPTAAAIGPGATIPGQADRMMEELKNLAGRSKVLAQDLETLTKETTVVMKETQALLRDVRQGEGPVGKEVVTTLRQLQRATESVGQSFDAMANVPLLSRYGDTSTAMLVRPNAERHAHVFDESELFEPGRALLTAEGRKQLDALAANPMLSRKIPDSEIVIASYTDTSMSPRAAEILTQKQSEAVRAYLVEKHKVHKLGWWRRREVIALGMGTRQPPGEAPSASTPARRVEVIIFVPPGSNEAP